MIVGPAELAGRAAELLAGLEAHARRMEELSEDDRLALIVNGGFTRANENARWTLELSIGYSLAAIAAELGEIRERLL